MRRSPVITALFPQVRGRILAATLTRPGKCWYLSELSTFLGTRPSSLQREIDALSKAGILEQWQDGRRVYLRPDVHSPVFSDLKGLFEKTTGLIPLLQQELEPYDAQLELAFVYGSLARSEEVSNSDIDLMVVGQVGLADLIPALRNAEQVLGRPVNATVFSTQEFIRKARVGDHFLSSVLRGPKQFVKGGEIELESIAG